MLSHLFTLGQHELTSINTVADMTLYVGINFGNAMFVVVVEGFPGDYVKECSPEAAKAVLRLFIEGDDVPDAAKLHELAGPLMPSTPEDAVFRCIP